MALVFGDDFRDPFDHGRESLERNDDAAHHVHRGKCREIIGFERLQNEGRPIARYGDGSFLRFETHCGVGELLDDIEEQLLGNDNRAFLFDERGHIVANGAFEVGGLHDKTVAFGLDVDARKHRKGRPRRRSFGDDGQGIEQLALVDVEFHAEIPSS